MLAKFVINVGAGVGVVGVGSEEQGDVLLTGSASVGGGFMVGGSGGDWIAGSWLPLLRWIVVSFA